MHKDIFYSITNLKLLKHMKVLSQVIFNLSNNNQKFLHTTFLTSLLETVQLITPNQDKQSNSFNA